MATPRTFLGMEEVSNRLNDANKELFNLASDYRRIKNFRMRIEYNEKMHIAIEKEESYLRKAQEVLIKQLIRDCSAIGQLISSQPKFAIQGAALIDEAERILGNISNSKKIFSHEFRAERILHRHAVIASNIIKSIKTRMSKIEISARKEEKRQMQAQAIQRKQAKIIPFSTQNISKQSQKQELRKAA